MKKIILFVLIVCSFNLKSQTDLQNLARGLVSIMPNVPSVYTRYNMKIHDDKKDVWLTKEAIIISAKKEGYSVASIVISNNYYIVFGYCPEIINNRFTGKGEFVMFEKENGEIKEAIHFTDYLTEQVHDNEKSEVLKSHGVVVSISNKFEVDFMIFSDFSWIFPIGYFEYK